MSASGLVVVSQLLQKNRFKVGVPNTLTGTQKLYIFPWFKAKNALKLVPWTLSKTLPHFLVHFQSQKPQLFLTTVKMMTDNSQ